MESILVHPDNAEQLQIVKAFLKDLKVKFESQATTFPPRVLKGIEESIEQHEKGQTISLQEFKDKYLVKK